MSQRVELEGCAGALELLEAWIDGDLDDVEAAAVEVHIAGCRSCQAERRLAEEVVAELRAMPEFDIPERVMQSVRDETRAGVMEKLHSLFEGAARRPLPAAAALAVVVLTLVLVPTWFSRPGPVYSDQEISRAADEARLAFAYVGAITRRAELRVKERVLDQKVAAQTVRSVRRSFQIIGGAGSAATDPPATPQPRVKGS